MKNFKVNEALAICLTSTLILTTGCQSNKNQITDQQRIDNEITLANKDNEKKEFDNFQTEQEEVETYMFEENFEKGKNKGKEYFIKGIDFVFYGTTYKGITFDELKDDAKKETLRNLRIIDIYIENIYPDYKEDFSEKYQTAAEFTNEKYHLVLDKVREYIGDENYNSVTEIKNQIKDDTKELGEKTKTKISDWYQDFKQN